MALYLGSNKIASGAIASSSGGDIVESGSNLNGSYIKYSDGTMICYVEYKTTLTCNNVWGNLYIGTDRDTKLYFPQPFIDVPHIQKTLLITSSSSCWPIDYNMPEITKEYFKNFAIARATASASVPIQLNILAIGRWK